MSIYIVIIQEEKTRAQDSTDGIRFSPKQQLQPI